MQIQIYVNEARVSWSKILLEIDSFPVSIHRSLDVFFVMEVKTQNNGECVINSSFDKRDMSHL